MSITVAGRADDITVLELINKPLLIYTNDWRVYIELGKIREQYRDKTILIFGKENKTPELLVDEYTDKINTDIFGPLEPFTLPFKTSISDVFVPVMIFSIFLILIVLIILSFMRK